MQLVSMMVIHQSSNVIKISQYAHFMPSPQPPSVLVKQMRLLAGGKSGTGSSRVNQLPSWEQNPRILFPPHIQLLGVVHLAFSLFLVSPCIFFFLLNKQACLIQDSQDVRAPSSHESNNS